MKKIINGKLYNTETATFIASYENHYMPSDFRYCEESLYRKRTGEFFLYGSGGPLSKYAEPYDNGARSGSAIAPLTEELAREWVENYANVETYVQLFGEPEE